MRSFPPQSIFLLAFLLAGCTGSSPQSGGAAADVLRCSFLYPDNSSVDCAQDVGRLNNAQPPADWSCVEEIGVSDRWVQLWTDRQGHYGVKGHSLAEGDLVTQITLQVEGGAPQATRFHHLPNYFAALEPALDRSAIVDWKVETWNFTGTLRIEPDQVLPVKARASEYDGDLWFIYAFEAPTTTYYAQSMGHVRYESLEWWSPASGLKHAGTDFRLSVHAGHPMQSHGEYVPREPDPLDALPDLPGGSVPPCSR